MKQTANQIAKMKTHTIGVEVEMNNITRSRAAQTASKVFGTGRYQDTHIENGYRCWSAWDAKGREWKFQRDVSIKGIDSEKCELVTPVLTYDDIELLQELIRGLRKAGAKSYASQSCGVHIHLGAGDHTAQTLRNLANLMASHEELIKTALNLDENRIRQYCKTVNKDFLKKANKEKPETLEELSDIWYEATGCTANRGAHYNQSRYHMLNLHAAFTKGTVEFRLFQFDEPENGRLGGLHAGQLKAYIQFCLAINQLAKDQTRASAKPQQKENPKYAMRTWLLRLGFIGEEFATARKFFTTRLNGDAAFRNKGVD